MVTAVYPYSQVDWLIRLGKYANSDQVIGLRLRYWDEALALAAHGISAAVASEGSRDKGALTCWNFRQWRKCICNRRSCHLSSALNDS